MRGGANKVINPLILVVVGLILTPIVGTQATAAKTGLGSFTGAAALMDIVPLVWVAGIIGLAGWMTYSNFRGGGM